MLTISALMASLCVVILSLGSLVESLDVSLAVLAGLLVMIVSAEFGDRAALSVFLAAGLISLLLPMKSPGILFLSFGGWYPVAQKKIQMLKPFWARLVKTLLFNIVLIALETASAFVTGTREQIWLYGALLLLGNLFFYLYDLLLDRFLIWYFMKLRSRLKF